MKLESVCCSKRVGVGSTVSLGIGNAVILSGSRQRVLKGCVVGWSGLETSKDLAERRKGAMNVWSCFKKRWQGGLFAIFLD